MKFSLCNLVHQEHCTSWRLFVGTISLLRLPEVRARTGLSRSAIYALIARGEFPRPVALTARAVAWRSDAVDSWIVQRFNKRHG